MNKAAIMVAPYNFTLRTTAAITLVFTANEEKFVPALAVGEARKRGAKVVRYVDGKGLALNLDPDAPEAIRADQDSPLDDADNIHDAAAVAEETMNVSDQAVGDRELPEKSTYYTPRETKILKAIEKVIAEAKDTGDVEEFFAGTSGYPKVNKIQKHLAGSTITATERNAVFDKMKAEGLIPDELMNDG